jgi:hypothetical protein
VKVEGQREGIREVKGERDIDTLRVRGERERERGRERGKERERKREKERGKKREGKREREKERGSERENKFGVSARCLFSFRKG